MQRPEQGFLWELCSDGLIRREAADPSAHSAPSFNLGLLVTTARFPRVTLACCD